MPHQNQIHFSMRKLNLSKMLKILIIIFLCNDFSSTKRSTEANRLNYNNYAHHHQSPLRPPLTSPWSIRIPNRPSWAHPTRPTHSNVQSRHDVDVDPFREILNAVQELKEQHLLEPSAKPKNRYPGNFEHNRNKYSEDSRSGSREGGRSEFHTDHSCYRPCSADPSHRMTCSFNFVVANYFTVSPHCMECPNVTMDCSRHGCLAADGRKRPVAVVNKIMPGPGIHVCLGDTIVVDVENRLVGQETSIHWHGMHQERTPWMDGVPSVTQCTIPPGTIFRYQFDALTAGTHFWHSHAGVQRADGVVGALIVRRPASVDGHSKLYDYDLAEHEIIVWDWLSDLAVTGFIVGHVTDQRELPRSILVHGKGFPPGYFEDFEPYDTIQSKGEPHVPVHEVRVRQNRSYRLRIISNGITLCPVELSIENHPILVIATDGNDVVPVVVQSLVIQAGERYDIVIRANQPVGSYWMKFRGLIDCQTTKTFQLAILNYEGIPRGSMPRHTVSTWEEAGSSNPGLQLNPININSLPGQYMTVAELSSVLDPDPQIVEQRVADHQFYLTYDFNPVPNVNFGKPTPDKPHRQWLKERERIVSFLPQLNFISHKMPPSPPLSQPNVLSSMERCNDESKKAIGTDCTRTHCECTHWLTVGVGEIIELVLVDMGVLFDAAHTFHLHGHYMRVMAIERLGNSTDPSLIKEWDKKGLLPRRRRNAAIKDTVYVPDGGYTILRFRANNPGYWLFHCHIEFHAERGMSLIFQVGNQNEIPRPPPDFPRCGNYMPPVKEPRFNYLEFWFDENIQFHKKIKITVYD